MADNYSTYNSLMKHIRSKGIAIKGSVQKKNLKNVGYYHGYKGYRFKGDFSHKLAFDSFEQINAVIEFDNALKAALYSPLMKLETAIKSHVCDVIVTTVESSEFSVVFNKGLTTDSKKKQQTYKARDAIYSSLTKRYEYSAIVKHFYNADKPVPLWAIFEELMLGEMSNLIEVLNDDIKLKISKVLGIPQGMNTNGALLPKVVLAVKDLRNAVAHNKVIYDGRYMEFKKRNSLMQLLMQETLIPGIKCDSLFDDVVLVCFLLKNLGFPVDESRHLVKEIEHALSTLKTKLPNMLYQDVVSGFSVNKMSALKKYARSR